MQLFVHAAHMQPHNIPRSPLAAASWSAPPYLARSCRAVGLATFCPNLENLKFINIACAHFRKLLTAFRTRSQLFWASVSASAAGMWRLAYCDRSDSLMNCLLRYWCQLCIWKWFFWHFFSEFVPFLLKYWDKKFKLKNK